MIDTAHSRHKLDGELCKNGKNWGAVKNCAKMAEKKRGIHVEPSCILSQLFLHCSALTKPLEQAEVDRVNKRNAVKILFVTLIISSVSSHIVCCSILEIIKGMTENGFKKTFF